MDLGDFKLIGTCAAIGLVIGGIIYALLSPIMGKLNGGFKAILGVVLLIGGAALGVKLLPDHVAPYLGMEHKPDSALKSKSADKPLKEKDDMVEGDKKQNISIDQEAAAAYVAELLNSISDPFLVAVLEKQTTQKDALRARLETVYIRSGEEATQQELSKRGTQITQGAYDHFMPRSADESLLAAISQLSKMLKTLESVDPSLCHDWLYGDISGKTVDLRAVREAAGEGAFDTYRQTLADVVRSSSGYMPEYDAGYAEQRLLALTDQITVEIGFENIGFITSGQLPQNMDEERIVCSVSARFYDLVLADDKPTDLLRHYLLNGGL